MDQIKERYTLNEAAKKIIRRYEKKLPEGMPPGSLLREKYQLAGVDTPLLAAGQLI